MPQSHQLLCVTKAMSGASLSSHTSALRYYALYYDALFKTYSGHCSKPSTLHLCTRVLTLQCKVRCPCWSQVCQKSQSRALVDLGDPGLRHLVDLRQGPGFTTYDDYRLSLGSQQPVSLGSYTTALKSIKTHISVGE